MSRGPGKWQRLILDRVSSGAWCYLADLLSDGYTMSQYKALYRAADTLFLQGRLSWLRYRVGTHKVLIGPADAPRPEGRPQEPIGKAKR